MGQLEIQGGPLGIGVALTHPSLPPINVWAVALANQRAGVARAPFALVGDSTFASYQAIFGQAWTNMRQYAQSDLIGALYTAAGDAVSLNNTFCDANSAAGLSALVYDPRVSLFTWAYAAAGTANSMGGNTALNNTNANVYRVAFTDPIDRAEYYNITNPAYGVALCNIGGVSAGTVDLGVTASLKKTTFNAGSLAVQNIDLLKNVAGDSKFITLVGLIGYNSAAPKIEMLNLGVGSWTSGDWAGASLTYSPKNAVVVLAPKLIQICLDINDAQGAVSPTTHGNNIQALIDAWSPFASITLETGNPIGNAFAGNMPAIVQKTRDIATANGLRLNDTYNRWGGTYANAVTLGFMGTDQVHPVLLGYQDKAAHNYSLSLP